jgi:hypothetical protein
LRSSAAATGTCPASPALTGWAGSFPLEVAKRKNIRALHLSGFIKRHKFRRAATSIRLL